MPVLRLLLLGLLAAVLGGAADPWVSLRPPMRRYGLQEGLPNGTVYAIQRDRVGRLWVATQDGVAHYDGRSWTPVNLPSSSTTRFVRTLVETPDGSWWFGTETDGLWRLKQGIWSNHSLKKDLPSDRVNTLLVVQDGPSWTLMVGTGGGGIATYREGTWSWEPSDAPAGRAWIWKFNWLPPMQGHGPRLAAAAKEGVFVLEEGRRVPYVDLPGLVGIDVNDLLAVPEPGGGHRIWASVWNLGLMVWNGTRWETHTPANGFSSRFPVTLATTTAPDGSSRLWAATYSGGLAWRDNGAWHVLDEARGLPANGVYSLLVGTDGEPVLWAGLRGGGLVALSGGGWWSLDRKNGLPTAEVFALAEVAGLGGPWIGTARGVFHWNGVSWVREGAGQGLPFEHIQTLTPAAGRPGLWAGTLQGLAFRDVHRWQVMPIGLPLGPNRIVSLLETSGEAGAVLWIGTEGGLIRRDRLGSRRLTTDDGLPANNAYSLRETRDAQGRPTLWVGTRGGGVARLFQGTWHRHGREMGLPNSTVYGLGEHRTADGRRWLWAGTFGGGGARLDLDHPDRPWEVVSSRTLPGLTSDAIVRVETDAKGRLYLATQRGVARILFEDPKDPARPTRAEMFGGGDGLAPIACSYGASMRDPQGRVWVATVEGVAAFDADLERPAGPLGTLLLARVQLGERELPVGAELVLGHRDGPLNLSFSLPRLHREEDQRFRTQLIGAEAEPGPWEPRAFREFTALKPGRYVLRVWGRDHHRREVGPLDIPFRVRPPWWGSPWAIGAGLVLLGAGLVLAHRLRIRILQHRTEELRSRIQEATAELQRRQEQLERLNEEKNQFMGIAAHDLRSPLNAIGLSAEELAAPGLTSEEASSAGNRIRGCVEQMTVLIQNLLDINLIESGRLRLEPERVDLRMVAAELQHRYQEKARAKGQRIELHTPWDEVPAWIDLVHGREVLDNLVSNAVKFTPPGPPERVIRLWVRSEAGAPLVEVVDQGPGLTAEDRIRLFGRFAKLSARPTGGESSTGLGLSIVWSLTEAMGGRIEVESVPGAGTTFRVHFPGPPPDAPAPEAGTLGVQDQE